MDIAPDKLASTPSPLPISWRHLAPRRDQLWRIFIGYGLIAGVSAVFLYGLAVIGVSDAMIGGDFTAFYVAANAASDGLAIEIYDKDSFQALLNTTFPGRNDLGLSWQYPPTYLLLISIFAALPYLAGFSLFSGASAIAYGLCLRKHALDPLVLVAILASPSAFIAFTTGQNGFLIGALLILASYNPQTRPIIAGLAAGLLTIKPHLGLLLPVAYLAVGAWRAAGIATLTASALIIISIIAYGLAPWNAFVDSLLGVAHRVSEGAMPLAKMASPYSAALYAGAGPSAAKVLQVVAMVITACAVWSVWRGETTPQLKAATLITCTFLAAPYSFYYELIILGLPIAVLATSAYRSGWLRDERAALAAVWVLTLATPFFAQTRMGLSTGFVAACLICLLILKRTRTRGTDWRR